MTTTAMFLDLSQVDWGKVALVFAYFLNFLAVIAVVFVERRSQTSAILWCVVLILADLWSVRRRKQFQAEHNGPCGPCGGCSGCQA